MPATPAGWCPVAPTSACTHRFKPAVASHLSHFSPIRFFPASSSSASLCHRAPSPATPVPATPPHQRSLHLHDRFLSSLRTRCSLRRRGKPSRRRNCSPEFDRAHRRALLRGTRPSAPPFTSLLRAPAPHASPEPMSPSSRPSSAGDGSPPGSSSAAPPLATTSLFRSSSGLAACTNVTALAWWSRRW
jgi:hypothetical protein